MIGVIGVGAGGHSKVMIEILKLQDEFEIMGLLDPNKEFWGMEFNGISVLGDDRLLPELFSKGIRHVFIGLGSVGDTTTRTHLWEKIIHHGFEVIHTIHPKSIIMPSVRMGSGLTVMAGAVINTSVRLGDNVIVNTGAVIDHDCVIESHAHIATGARLAGNVHVGKGSHVGIGASVRQNIRIGRKVIVGAGAAVVNDIEDNTIVAGVPARILEKVKNNNERT